MSSPSMPLQIVPRLVFLFLLLSLSSCYRVIPTIEPHLCEPLHPKEAAKTQGICIDLPEDFSRSPFCPLSPQELAQDWGKELKMALCFASDFDLFRAITGFKRALFLLPCENKERRVEIEYDIALAYYLGKKYGETVFAIEQTELVAANSDFPAFGDLLLILYDCRKHLGQTQQAEHLFALIEQFNACQGEKLSLLSALECGDCATLMNSSESYIREIATCYCSKKKSVKKAQLLNAVLPGSGYWYIGQRHTATTAFLVNALFIAAGVEFLTHGYTAAGIITLSLESGWYFGGIYGGGLAAKYYNERLYENLTERITHREKLFPLMMLRYTF